MPKQQPSSTTANFQNSSNARRSGPPENFFLNIGFNLFLPIFILNKGKKWFGHLLEPYFENVTIPILLMALAFPITYFIYDHFKRQKYNVISILGLISVLLTGGIGILNIPTEWFAVKEAAIPALIGIAVVASLKTPYPLIRTLLYNPEIIDLDKVQEALVAHKSEVAFEKLLAQCTYLLAASFLLSAVLNYSLARWIVVSPSGSDAFNAEVGKMMAWSWPVIVVPSMSIMMLTLYLLIGGIRKMTGLKLEEILRGVTEVREKS